MLELSNGESNFEELMRISFNNSSWYDLGPFRKEMKVKVKSCLTLWDTMDRPQWNFPGKNTGVGCHFLLQGIFPT